MELNNKNLESLLLKAEQDPEIMEIVRNLIRWSQMASEEDVTLAELAALCTVGWQIGKDPQLQAMIEYMFKISQMGIGPEH